LKNVIEDALDLSLIENGAFKMNEQLEDPRDAIKEVADCMRFQIEKKGLRLDVQIDPSLPRTMKLDPKRFKQILFNLTGNAVKFTRSGYIRIRSWFENRTFINEVKDSGVGIPASEKDRLFNFFGKLTDNQHMNQQGIGLGLVISKMIVEKCGGTITVSSEEGKGTTFTFYLKPEVPCMNRRSQSLSSFEFLDTLEEKE